MFLFVFYICMRKTTCVLFFDFIKLIKRVTSKYNFEQKDYEGV